MTLAASATCTAIGAACSSSSPTTRHGYETPVCPGQPTLAEAGLDQTYNAAMDARTQPTARCAMRLGGGCGLPAALGTRVRAVFKMDFAEALYIAELRSGVAGTSATGAWRGRCTVRGQRHPALASYFASRCECAVDLLKR